MGHVRFFSFEAFGVSSPFDPTFHYVTSPVFPPVVLGVLRLIFAAYTSTTAIITFVLHYHHASYFSYFTNLNYIGLVAYFWASGVQTIAFVLYWRKSYPLQSWPRFLQLLHLILYSSIIVYPIIVTAVFWTLIASPATFASTYDIWSNVSVHAMNSLFALFEIVFTHGGPSPWTHLVPLALMLMCYLGVVYITYATQGFYTYTFLDPSGGRIFKVVTYIIGIAVGCCLMFSIVKGVCSLRHRISLRYDRFEHYSSASRTLALDEWEELGSMDAPTRALGVQRFRLVKIPSPHLEIHPSHF